MHWSWNLCISLGLQSTFAVLLYECYNPPSVQCVCEWCLVIFSLQVFHLHHFMCVPHLLILISDQRWSQVVRSGGREGLRAPLLCCIHFCKALPLCPVQYCLVLILTLLRVCILLQWMLKVGWHCVVIKLFWGAHLGVAYLIFNSDRGSCPRPIHWPRRWFCRWLRKLLSVFDW